MFIINVKFILYFLNFFIFEVNRKQNLDIEKLIAKCHKNFSILTTVYLYYNILRHE